MNKLVFLFSVTIGGALGAALRGPFVPLVVYYFYGVLRPNYLWDYDLLGVTLPILGQANQIGWSFYTAIACVLSYLPWALGVVGPRFDPERFVFPPFIWAHRWMLLFGIWCSISYGYAINQDRAWIVYQDLLKIFLIYLVSTQVIRAFWQVRVMFIMLTLTLGAISLDINQRYFETGYLLLLKKGYAGLDNNGAGLMLAMGVPLCYFAWEFTRGWYRWGYLLLIPPLIHAIVSSYSRGSMLSTLLVAPLYMLYSRKRKFLAACYVAVAMMIPFLAGKEIQDRFFSVEKAETDDSFQSRLDSWDAARKIANEYPFFGAGIRCSNLLSKEYGADMEGRTIHSNYLQIAADCGWCGLLVYLVTLGCIMVSIWKTRVRLWPYQDEAAVQAVAMLGGIECSLWTFIVGAIALSLETFELPYMMMLFGAQMWAIANAKVYPPPGVPLAMAPMNQVGATGRPAPLIVVDPRRG